MVPESPTPLECFDCGKAHPPRAPLIPTPFLCIISQKPMPTTAETAAIRRFISAIDTEISRREQAIDRLRCEVAVLRRLSEQHKYIIAPIRRVPPEIMAEIFLHLTAIEAKSRMHRCHGSGCASFFAKNDEVRPVLHRAPLIFGEVSRYWRDIAFSTPRLWNSISIDCTHEKLQDRISLCDAWLKRSGSLPLSIRFHRAPESQDPSQYAINDCQNLLQTILPYAQRWRLLELADVPASSYDGILQGCLPNSLPVLEALSVGSSPPDPSSSEPWAELRTAPNLRFLRYDSIGDTSTEEWQAFPWSQLTHIDLGNCSADDCLWILDAAPTTVDCRFLIDRPSSFEHPPVSHSALETLRISIYVDIRLCLTCPRLSALEISVETSEALFHDLPSFIARLGPSLESFTLEGFDFHGPELMAFFADMPRIRHLCISEFGGPQFTDEVWESLTWQPDFAPLIPNLESLVFLGGRGRAFSYKTVVRILESRIKTPHSPAGFVPKLNTVDLAFWPKMGRSACRRIRAIRKFGLNIKVEENVSDDEGGSEDEGSDLDEDDSEGDSDGES
ncbi:hypothetical protein C8R45DRAFT_1204511 [Mycena sanguinolenta]|nr:hypothetical protein C8R45DRAFT_1204511 [Mycena sanguinolenta]